MRVVSDRVFEIRMKKPYALMPTALADWCFVMPERVAKTSPIDQQAFMQAAYGEEQDLYRTGVGVFTPGLPMATTAGLEALTGKRDVALAKRLVAQSGYAGEKVILMSPSDYADQQAYSQVFRELLQQLGIAVEYVSMDWGTLVQRRASREPGVWNSFCTTYEGMSVANPASHLPLRGNGLEGWFGWPTDSEMERLRDAWFEAPDLAAQRAICDKMQLLAFDHVPFLPVGQRFLPTAVRDSLEGIVPAS